VPVVAQPGYDRGHPLIVGRHRAGIPPGAQVFARVKAEAAGVGERARLDPSARGLEFRAVRLTGVFYYEEFMAAGHIRDLVDRAGQPI
jgi:hypothetical protein